MHDIVENDTVASKMDEDGTYTLTRLEWERASQISRPLRNVEKLARRPSLHAQHPRTQPLPQLILCETFCVREKTGQCASRERRERLLTLRERR